MPVLEIRLPATIEETEKEEWEPSRGYRHYCHLFLTTPCVGGIPVIGIGLKNSHIVPVAGIVQRKAGI
jgi:hypothetical protein